MNLDFLELLIQLLEHATRSRHDPADDGLFVQERKEWDLGRKAVQNTDYEDPATCFQGSERLRQAFAPDNFQYVVGTLAVRELEHFLLPLRSASVVDSSMSAESFGALQLFIAARGNESLCPEGRYDL